MCIKGRPHGTMKVTTASDEWSFAGEERGSVVPTSFLCQQWMCWSRGTHPPSTAKAGGRGWTNQPSETQQGTLASPFVLMDHLGGSAQLETHRRGAVICPPPPEPCPLGSPATAEWEWDQGFRDSGALTAVEKTFQAVAGA